MYTSRQKFNILLIVSLSILLLSGCIKNDESIVDNYSVSLSGESETWDLSGYEVSLRKDSFTIGNGTLRMKNEKKYLTNSFSFKTYIIINDEKLIVHSGSTTGEEFDIQKRDMGHIESNEPFSNQDSLEINNSNEIYMEIEWIDSNKVTIKETIKLHSSFIQ